MEAKLSVGEERKPCAERFYSYLLSTVDERL